MKPTIDSNMRGMRSANGDIKTYGGTNDAYRDGFDAIFRIPKKGTAVPKVGMPHGCHRDPVEFFEGSWGFWDETWATFYGDYATEAEARVGMERYVNNVLIGPTDRDPGDEQP